MVLVLVIVAVLIIVFVYSRYSSQQYEKDSCAKLAAEISKQFGSRSITLFRFDDCSSEFGRGEVLAFLPCDQYSIPYDLTKITEYKEIYSWHEKSAFQEKDSRQMLSVLKSILPYQYTERKADIDWYTYIKSVAARKRAAELDDWFDKELNVCYSVIGEKNQLIFLAFGRGKPLSYMSENEALYDIFYQEDFDIDREHAIATASLILKYSNIKDKTIHHTNKTWDDAFSLGYTAKGFKGIRI